MAEIDNKEDQIVEISNDVDELLVELSNKHKQHPLNLASIILARLMVMCNATNCLDEFVKIVEQIEGDIDNLTVGEKSKDEVIH